MGDESGIENWKWIEWNESKWFWWWMTRLLFEGCSGRTYNVLISKCLKHAMEMKHCECLRTKWWISF